MTKKYLPLFLILLLSVLLRSPIFLSDFVNIDENEYAIAAQKILAGGLPYKDVLIYQPPVIYYLYALGFWAAGGIHIWSAHLLSIFFAAGTSLALYFLSRTLTGSQKSGFIAALAYTVFSVTFIPQDMLAANCEIFMMLPLTLSALTLYHAETSTPAVDTFVSTAGVFYILTGIFASLGFLTKYQGGIVVVAHGIYLPFFKALLTKRFSIRENIVPTFLLVVGFVLPIGAVLYLLWLGDALKETLEALTYIFLYAHGPVQNDPFYVFLKFISRTFLFILPGIVMWLGASHVILSKAKDLIHIRRFFARLRRTQNDSTPQLFPFFCILWFFISAVPILVGGRIYFHYYFTLLPPAALLFSLWWREKGQYLKKLKWIAFTWSFICVIGWTTYAVYKPFKPWGPKDDWRYVVSYLKENTKEGETLFVWGYCPQIYISSGLKAETRFTTADYLTGRSPMTAGLEYDPLGSKTPSSVQKLVNDFVDPVGIVIFDTSSNIFPKAWDYLRADFEKELPTYIIDTAHNNYRRYGRYPIQNFPYLAGVLKDNYTLINSVKGFDIYKKSLR